MTTIEAVTPESPVTLSGKYTIDSVHSRIGFVARHLMITKVRGSFDEFEGKATLDAQNPENSSVEIVIQAKSVNTRNQMRDDHLHSNDFLAVEEFPEIRFSSTKVTLLAGELEKGDEASRLR
jgi:polyisoprenoid-binding protein YceI